jgi:hypothetical protein
MRRGKLVKTKTINKSIIGLYVFLLVIVGLVLWVVVRPDFRNVDASTVLFTSEQVKFLQSEYKLHADIINDEVVYCLSGDVKSGVVVISDISIPSQTSDEVSASYQRCGGLHSLGTIHFQPRNRCDLSRQDFYTFGREKYLVFGVMCGETDMALYSNKDLYSKMEVGYK